MAQARAFVIRPFGIKKDSSGKEIDFDRVHDELIDPALEANELEGRTTIEIVDAGNIREDMFQLILEADLIVCDVTVHNANVFYELGIRHALRKKRTVMIKGEPAQDATPFDLLTDRYLTYPIDNPSEKRDSLEETIRASMRSGRPTDSPIFQMLPGLSEADPSEVRAVPPDFQEEVRRAAAVQSKGWLRLLSGEVGGQRFQWEGLKLVASAQWSAKDYDGAVQSWEKVRDVYPDDIDANLALANIYERQSRAGQPELLEKSDQALERVIKSESVSRKQIAEALALKGRNQKTHWRSAFKNEDGVKERRALAINRALIRSYESYLEAYFEDLNHFYSGLAVLQMGSILLDLSGDAAWEDAFDNDRDAENYRLDLDERVMSLRALVPMSVEAALRKMDEKDPEFVWAKISEADVLFLTSDRERRILKGYRDAIPEDAAFAWDAAKGQLQLFQELGVRADYASAVISNIDGRLTKDGAKSDRPIHVVVFAGHHVDEPERPEPRFPAEQEAQAKAFIRKTMEEVLDDDHNFVGLASASPGADILWHETCDELGLTSTVCLPMPEKDYAVSAFENLDSWRTRFLDLVEVKKHPILTLSDRKGLPRWLGDRRVDAWERGNAWVMEMALASGADRMTLVALWDGKARGDAPGGTAQVVSLARDSGAFRIHQIDSNQLVT